MQEGRPQRVSIAAAALLILATVVGVVLLARAGGGDDSSSPPPPGCARDWNFDPTALTFGEHNYVVHGYNRVRLLLLDRDADEVPQGSRRGFCAVVFPARTLDPEPPAAGMIRVGGTWRAISSLPGVETDRLAELQSEAVPEANADLLSSGKLAPF
jgi:hypothetical protein